MAIIFDFDDEKWEQEKQEWREKIENSTIPEDPAGGAIHQLEYELDQLYTEASWYHTNYKIQYENLKELIDKLEKKMKTKGGNKEEREANCIGSLMNYPAGEKDENQEMKTINLYIALGQLRDRYYFFRDYVIKNIDKRSSRLMTSVGAGKVDAIVSSRPGA